ncbi:MAG: hypothetical protein ABII93_07750 [Chrysiogenia bacterium]
MIKLLKPHKLRIAQGLGTLERKFKGEGTEFEIFERNRVYNCLAVARRLRQSESSIREKVFYGQIPYFKAGEGKNASVRFYGGALNDWLARINRLKLVPGEKQRKPRKKPIGKGLIEFENLIEKLKDKG